MIKLGTIVKFNLQQCLVGGHDCLLHDRCKLRYIVNVFPRVDFNIRHLCNPNVRSKVEGLMVHVIEQSNWISNIREAVRRASSTTYTGYESKPVIEVFAFFEVPV